jgi:hypothetical protein
MTTNTTSSLTNEVAIYYDKVFLERARAMLVHQEGGQLRGIDGNVGKETIFNRFSPLAITTTPLSEGVNPSGQTLVSTQVIATLAEYGNSAVVSRLLSTTDIDDRDKEKIDVIGQNMGRICSCKIFSNQWGNPKLLREHGNPQEGSLVNDQYRLQRLSEKTFFMDEATV